MSRGNVEGHTRTGRKGRTRQVAAAMRQLSITRDAMATEIDPVTQVELSQHAEQLAATVAGLAVGMHTKGHSRRGMLERMTAAIADTVPMSSVASLRQVGDMAITNIHNESHNLNRE